MSIESIRDKPGFICDMDGVVYHGSRLLPGVRAYFPGKPNPLMMRHALDLLRCRREDTVIVGDRMDTDILAGIEAQIETVLVLTGVTAREDLDRYAYRPDHVVENVGSLVSGA